jgi:hypothetical protein
MSQEGRPKKHLWWDACGLWALVFLVGTGAAVYYLIA